jgi:hypothetical protein
MDDVTQIPQANTQSTIPDPVSPLPVTPAQLQTYQQPNIEIPKPKSKLKKILLVIGIAALIIIASVFLFSAWGNNLDRESKDYVDKNIPVIISAWDYKELVKRASPELLNIAPDEKFKSLFDTLSEKLGKFKKYNGSKGEASINTVFFTKEGPFGYAITAAYSADDVVFENDSAQIKIELVLRDNEWRILSFYVYPENLE